MMTEHERPAPPDEPAPTDPPSEPEPAGDDADEPAEEEGA